MRGTAPAAACERCLRSSYLVRQLAPRIAAILDSPRRRARGVLALEDEELIAAVAGPRRAEAHDFLARFDPAARRAELVAAGVGAVCRHADGYPAGLRDLADPPPVLYWTGQAEAMARLEGDAVVTLVGARRASPYGLEVARELGRGLGVAGVTVVSGLALGIDAAAHRGTLAGGGVPVAVLARGVDRAYPRTHRALFEEVRRRGAVVAELPPGQEPFRWSFPARNRIMAALASLTVIVEAGEPSGSLITAEFAADTGRAVGAVPGRVTSRQAAGTNRLLRDGADVIRSAEDVLDLVYGAGRRPEAATLEPSKLEPALRRVLDHVEGGGGLDAMAIATGLAPGELRAALGRLELLGLVARHPLGGYERRAAR